MYVYMILDLRVHGWRGVWNVCMEVYLRVHFEEKKISCKYVLVNVLMI